MNYDTNTLVAAIVNQAVTAKQAADFSEALNLAKSLNEQLEKTRAELNEAQARNSIEIDTLRRQINAMTQKEGV